METTGLKKSDYVQHQNEDEDIEMMEMKVGGGTAREDSEEQYQNLNQFNSTSEYGNIDTLSKEGFNQNEYDEHYEESKEGERLQNDTTQDSENDPGQNTG